MTIFPSDDSSIYSGLSMGGYSLVTPSSPPEGIAGFIFDVTLDEVMELSNSITQHFVEDNTVVSDHIANNPEVITLNGFVAELTRYTSSSEDADRLEATLAAAPGLGANQTEAEQDMRVALLAASENYTTSKVLQAAKSLYGQYKNGSAQAKATSKQVAAAGYFYQLWKGKVLCTVDTPFGLMTNMAVQRVTMRQPEQSSTAAEFSVTFEHVRMATVSEGAGQLAGRRTYQAAATVNAGKATLSTSSAPLSAYISKLTPTQ